MSGRPVDLHQLRPPRLQTSSLQQRPQTAPQSGTPTSATFNNSNNNNNTTPTNPTVKLPPQNKAASTINVNATGAGASEKPSPPAKPGHQRFVLTDPVAFRYLEEDPSTRVLERSRQLQGYECYIVEQWTTSRSHPTFTITTHTGDPSSTVTVGVLSVPTDESTWSARLRVYFKALNQYHARRRETPLGILMVTNLSGFPSSLTVIPVPDGDLRKHRSDFFVNENLKRLNCSGRVGLTLVPPTGATVAKFHQVYRTSDKNEIYHSVIELVKLCQSALLLFAKLEVDYADGLLCDVTERAINDWWVEIGSEYYSVEPHDGILGPTTVAGLLGLLMGARNRLHSVSAPVTKDPFDVEGMKKGISAFQKSQRLPRSRRLDRRTMERLHRVSQKAANSEGLYWTGASMLPKAVKSTVAELSGKGGEMVTDLVHRKDRAGIAEVETCDMERFVQLCYGERAKWLWYGKVVKRKTVKEAVGQPMKIGEENGWGEVEGKALNFKESEHGGFTWTARKSVADGMGNAGGKKESQNDSVAGSVMEEDGSGEEDEGVKGLIKRTSGFVEAKSGLGKVKGAVGFGGGSQKKKLSKDNIELPPQTPPQKRPPQKYPARESTGSPQSPASPSPRTSMDDSPKGQQWPKRPVLQRSRSSPVASYGSPRSSAHEQRPSWNVAESIPEQDAAPAYAASYREVDPSRQSRDTRPPSYMSRTDYGEPSTNRAEYSDDQASESITIEPSIAGSVYNDVELNTVLPTGPETEQDVSRLLRRTISDSQFVTVNLQSHSDDAYPRNLSFSLAEESVLTWPEIVYKERDSYFEAPEDQMVDEQFLNREATQLQQMIQNLSASTATFTQKELHTLQSLLSRLSTDAGTLSTKLYAPCADRVQHLRTSSETVLRNEKDRLEEGGKELETLAAKLEYEISGLKGRVEEVLAGVGACARGVQRVEERVGELEREEKGKEEGEGRWGCVVS